MLKTMMRSAVLAALLATPPFGEEGIRTRAFVAPAQKEPAVVFLPHVPPERMEEAIYWLALALYYEARGEGVRGMVAVGFVVLNRVMHSRFPSTVKAVVTEGGEKRHRCQFSFRCDGKGDAPTEANAWKLARQVARRLIRGHFDDPTGGAVFYFNPALASPCWGRAPTFIAEIGSHRFYGEIPWEVMKRLCRRSTKVAAK